MTEPRYTVQVDPAGWQYEAPASLSLLQSALRQGLRLPSSCRNGTCRACLCRLTQGQIAYRIEWPGLSAQEKQEGYILPCVAQPRSDVVLHVPFASRETDSPVPTPA